MLINNNYNIVYISKSNKKESNNQIRNVLSGIDTLYIGFYVAIKQDILDELVMLKDEAQEPSCSDCDKNDPVFYDIGGQRFEVSPVGKQRYAYVLKNSDYTIDISRIANAGYPEVYVEIRSIKLWEAGVEQAVLELRHLVGQLGMILGEKVSRVDFCADFVGVDIDKDTIWQFVSKAVDRSLHAVGSNQESITGMTFGKGDIVGRIYNKSKEIERSKKEWFYDLWGLAKESSNDVWRVEFQLRRDCLKQFGVEDFNDLQEISPDIWQYLTHKWLSMRELDNDNITRRSLTRFWEAVQSVVSFFGKVAGVVRDLSRNATINGLVAMIKGCVTKAGALRGKISGVDLDLSDTLKWIDNRVVVELAGVGSDSPFVLSLAELKYAREVSNKAVFC